MVVFFVPPQPDTRITGCDGATAAKASPWAETFSPIASSCSDAGSCGGASGAGFCGSDPAAVPWAAVSVPVFSWPVHASGAAAGCWSAPALAPRMAAS